MIASPRVKEEAAKAWQRCGYVHPMTCGNSSGHLLLVPKKRDGDIIMVCRECRWTQPIPDVVVEWYNQGGPTYPPRFDAP